MTRKQCKACPWKKSTVPDRDIPGGYCAKRHRALKSTIAEPAALTINKSFQVMACHETMPGKELPCVGWLAHQLGRGNNIALRLAALHDRTLTDFKTVGPQHEKFEDTL